MYCVTRDVLRYDLTLGKNIVFVIHHLGHVLTLESLFLLSSSLDNIPPKIVTKVKLLAH